MKKKTYYSFPDIAYQDWVGLDDGDTYECHECNEEIEFPKVKCPDCGSIHKIEYGKLEMRRAVIVKRKDYFPKYNHQLPEPVMTGTQELTLLQRLKVTGKTIKELVWRS